MRTRLWAVALLLTAPVAAEAPPWKALEAKLEAQDFCALEKQAHQITGSKGEQFRARSLEIRALLGQRQTTRAWQLLRELETWDRSDFKNEETLDFYLARGYMQLTRNENLSRQNFEEAARRAGSRGDEVAFQRANLETYFGNYDEAQRQIQQTARHSSTPYWQAALHLAEARLLIAEGHPEQAWLPLRAAEVSFEQGKLPSGYASVEIVRATLEAKEGVPGRKRLWAALDRLPPDAVWSRLEVLARIIARISKADAPRAGRQFERIFRNSPETSVRLSIIHLLMSEDHASPELTAVRLRLVASLQSSSDPWVQFTALSSRERVAGRKNQLAELKSLLLQELSISERLKPENDDFLYQYLSPTYIHITLARLQRDLGAYEDSLHHFEAARASVQVGDHLLSHVVAQAGIMICHLNLLQIDAAEKDLQAGFDELEKFHRPVDQGIASIVLFQEFYHGVDPVYVAGPMRLRKDSPEWLLLSRLGENQAMQERFLGALTRWANTEEKSKSATSASMAYELKGLMLSCWDRPIEAMEAYTQAVEAAGNTRGREKSQALSDLAHELFGAGRVSEAIAKQRVALELARGWTQGAEVARHTRVLALMLSKNGSSAEAERLVRSVAEETPYSHQLMGQMFLESKRLPEARRELDLALERVGEHPRMRPPLYRLRAALEVEAGHLPEAEAEYGKAIEFQRKSRWTAGLAELVLDQADLRERQGDTAGALRALLAGVEDLRELQKELPAAFFATVLQDRAPRLLVERAAALAQKTGQPQEAVHVVSLYRGLESAQAVALPELEAERAKVARLTEKGGEPLRLAQQNLLSTLNRIRQRNPDYESLVSVGTDDLLAVQSHLAEETALVQYFPGEESLYIQALRRDKTVTREVRVGRKRIFELVARWRKSIQDPSMPPDLAAGQELSRILLEPIADALGPDVLILPTGDLWYLPWESLPSFPAARSVAYLSAGDLRRLGEPVSHPAGTVVAVASGNLEAARTEVARVAEVFPGSRALVGDASTVSAVHRAAEGARILHLATHGHLDGTDWNASSLALADGPLPISDVFGWKIPRGALVVLSACDSGSGQDRPGREVASLSRAFHFAGAGAVVSSLWPVDDEATAALFAEFYRELHAARTPGEALRGAKAKLQSESRWNHPAYWAAFVLQGDPR